MITIQSALFVALGGLVASLLWLLVAPAFWSRAVRLTERRMRETMPLTEAELAASKDKLRAEHAVKVHRLQSKLEGTRLTGARQRVEINRRDARVNGLESEIEALQARIEEATNARSVLEQTVADRLPRVEERLSEAKRLLFNRDREIDNLVRTAERQARAIEEAGAVNEQLRREVTTLTASLETAGARNHDGLADPRFDSEVAMRSEITALRSRTREQGAVIDRLQKLVGGVAMEEQVAATAGPERERLRSIAGVAEPREGEVPALRARLLAETAELERVRAALMVYEQAATADGTGGGESRIALKASLGALEVENAQQKARIADLTTELSALRAELAHRVRNPGSEERGRSDGAHVVAGAPRSEAAALPRLTLAERVARTREDVRPESSPGEGGEVVPLPAHHSTRNGNDASIGEPPSGEPEGARPEGSGAQRARSRLLDRMTDYSKA